MRDRLRWLCVVMLLLAALVSVECGEDGDDDDAASPADDDDTADDDGESPDLEYDTVALVTAPDAPDPVAMAVEDASALLDAVPGLDTEVRTSPLLAEGVLNVIVGAPEYVAEYFNSGEREIAAEGFRLRWVELEDGGAAVVAAGDERGLAYAVYELLERMGFRFFHPEETYRPGADALTWPTGLDVYETPDWPRRGFHFHTMHPIEASEFLMVDAPGHMAWAKRLIDWLARNKQNYWQFELLRTVDYDAMADYYRELVDYSHRRGVEAGVVVTWAFQQQKAWKLLPNGRKENRALMEEHLDQIMQVPWDHLNLEMGSTEFTEVEDTIQVAWMNNTVAYLGEHYPDTEASVKVHCSSGQTAPNYDDINFNFLVQEADPRMAAYPHTVQYYDLQGPAPVYDNADFSDLYEWMLAMVAAGDRKIYYYPETAYWCSFDIDVPLFLPVYLFNRWKDIQLLRDLGLDGHVTFTSGHEWGYWLNDWTVARFTWDSSEDWTDALRDFTTVFGPAAEPIADAVRDLTLAQEDLLIGRELASYLAGEDTWDELGYLLGSETHPKPVLFSELYRMKAPAVVDLMETTIADLKDMMDTFGQLRAKLDAAADQVPARAWPWYAELKDSFAVDHERARHAYHLWAGAAAQRLFELKVYPEGEGEAAAHFAAAKSVTRDFLRTMRTREASYRYPLSYSSGWGRSVTSYDFRYLYQAHTAYWYVRYEKQAIEKDFNPLLMNIIDPVWFFF